MLGILGIVLSLLLLMYLFDENLPVLATYTQIFMGSVGQFVRDYFPLFLLGAIFGKLMEDSGAAAKIADVVVRTVGVHRTILAVVLSCAILTYGGVSLFVVVFAVFPLSRSLFRQADIPRRLIPATIALGSFTFTMTAMPGTVQIQNLIPMPFFKTTPFAAPGLGCIGSLVMFFLGMMWLNSRAARAQKNGEGFGAILQSDDMATEAAQKLPNAWSSFAPIISVLVLNFVFSRFVIPTWDASYLADEQFGKTDLNRLLGTWSTILSMVVALLMTMAMHFRSLERLKLSLATGARASLLPIFNTASEVGYGSTIKSLAGFAIVQKFVTGIAPGNPLISESIAVNSLAAITGSASGGLSIALKALGETYYQRGIAAGINPELLHRVASMSCGGLDSLPHNGALITLLLICGVTHRQGYKDIAVVTILCPLAATVTVIALGTMFGSF